jgi:hypothetical protein
MEGDHVYIECFNVVSFTHQGIDCGDGTVIHFSKSKGKISRDSMSSFASASLDGNIYAYEYVDCYSPSVVVQRAKSKVGQTGYNLFGNNCEHFATWCKTGDWESQQVNNVAGVAGNIGAPALVALGLTEVSVATPGILGFLGMTTTAPLLGVAALPATILGAGYLAYKAFCHGDD